MAGVFAPAMFCAITELPLSLSTFLPIERCHMRSGEEVLEVQVVERSLR